MDDWGRIFARSAPGLLEASIRKAHQVGETDYRWELARHFLAWGVPVYLSALSSALGGETAASLAPGFIDRLEAAVQERGAEDDHFPAAEFLETVRGLRGTLGPLPETAARPGTGPGEDAEGEPIAFRVGEAAHDIVRVAFTMGREQFEGKDAGEAMTWIMAMGCSSFLNGLGLGLGEDDAERLRPAFFSRVRNELRDQYQEVEGYPLSHFLDITGSIGRRWIRLNAAPPPETD